MNAGRLQKKTSILTLAANEASEPWHEYQNFKGRKVDPKLYKRRQGSRSNPPSDEEQRRTIRPAIKLFCYLMNQPRPKESMCANSHQL